MNSAYKNVTVVLVVVLTFCFLGLPKNSFSQDKDLDKSHKKCADDTENFDTFKKLEQEITVTNLINGLYLSDEQMAKLLDLAKRTKEFKKVYLEKYSKHFESINQPLEKLKDELIKDKGYVAEEIKEEANKSTNKIHKARLEYAEEIDKLIEEAKNTLTPNQIYLIEHFKPCLIPPKGPDRIGQSSDSAGIANRLKTVREMSEEKYALKKDSIADKIIENLHLRKPHSIKIEDQDIKSCILSVFDEARTLSDLDFEMRKKELVKKITDKVLVAKEHKVDIDNRIENFLLSPAAISVLEEKMQKKEKKS